MLARRTRAYIADPQLHAWSILVDGVEHETQASLFPMEWGALLSTGVRMWRFSIGTEGWHRLEAAIPLSAAGIAVRPWGDEVLLTYQEAGRWTASNHQPRWSASSHGGSTERGRPLRPDCNRDIKRDQHVVALGGQAGLPLATLG